ncbi:MAG TPA: formate dehydrogenase subunit gamma [Nitrospiraceae bacterium]|nr:MAG: formate dehydrogenase subunit gamma [Nitrospirae bacterium GWA2_46_11]OGW24160.1 MAG: formate dehydrogenase subunit gamma [Nitrospirae bacterium GWB2_47_37]HAK89134.1 formate dehydrogenase subunit gamma [Nitrospiraceae bacterium]HCL80969.1 formate dehydrogenase subunit gamma [Nitrospiraceae bacterium]HCZ10832.1 formate dehydrogenase subunit gamma [Nitrospiraceae bacterium]
MTVIRKASAFEILNHWVLAVSFLILAISGFGFLFQLEQLNAVFGNFNAMKNIHNYAGIVFTASLILTIFHYLPVSLKFGADDIAWFLNGGGYLSKKSKVPPQDELNAGQKLYYIVILLSGLAIAASGFAIWLRPQVPDIRKLVVLSHLVHNIAFDLMIIAVPLHIYLATLANPGTLRIMITGTVPLEWARKRHAKWVRKMGY